MLKDPTSSSSSSLQWLQFTRHLISTSADISFNNTVSVTVSYNLHTTTNNNNNTNSNNNSSNNNTSSVILTLKPIARDSYCQALSKQEVCWGGWTNLTGVTLSRTDRLRDDNFTLNFISPSRHICTTPVYSFTLADQSYTVGSRSFFTGDPGSVTFSALTAGNFSLEVVCRLPDASNTVDHHSTDGGVLTKHIHFQIGDHKKHRLLLYDRNTSTNAYICEKDRVNQGDLVYVSPQLLVHVPGRHELRQFNVRLVNDSRKLFAVRIEVFHLKNFRSGRLHSDSSVGQETVIKADLIFDRDLDVDLDPDLDSLPQYQSVYSVNVLVEGHTEEFDRDHNQVTFRVDLHFDCSSTSSTPGQEVSQVQGAVPSSPISYHVILSRWAADFTRLVQLPANLINVWSNSSVLLRAGDLIHALALEPTQMVIYVANRSGLLELNSGTTYSVSVSTLPFDRGNKSYLARETGQSSESESVYDSASLFDDEIQEILIAIIAVEVVDETEPSAECTASRATTSWCASLDNRDDCESSCGVAVNSTCQWRSPPPVDTESAVTLSRHYGTCSPDLSYCPNGKCDPIEKANWKVCPQDCADSPVRFSLYHESPTGVGVLRARGVCKCDSPSLPCQCHPWSRLPPPQWGSAAGNGKYGEPTHSDTDELSCGVWCLLLVVFAILLIVIVLIILLSVIKRRVQSIQQKRRKNVISKQRIQLQQLLASTSTNSLTELHSNLPIAPEWEIERSRISMLCKLGEGEFGVVMKASLSALDSTEQDRLVAVKIAKAGDTGSSCSCRLSRQLATEFLAEFSTLQLLRHTNVCQLLGACTAGNWKPWLVVEFAELGCLRNYLIEKRKLISSGHLTLMSDYFSDELTLFALQIAEGMAYLGQMKMVHRDLAARNILLSAEKVCKISDFGLTRDIYRDSIYTKRSNGLVPVKWMAVESLTSSEYTAKSDVWSYGVLLWELVTLGQTPYPGVPNEQVASLIVSGYRMSRPQNCTDLMYNVMRICWQERPEDRAEFEQLIVIIGDQMATAERQRGNAFVNHEYMETNSGYEVADPIISVEQKQQQHHHQQQQQLQQEQQKQQQQQQQQEKQQQHQHHQQQQQEQEKQKQHHQQQQKLQHHQQQHQQKQPHQQQQQEEQQQHQEK